MENKTLPKPPDHNQLNDSLKTLSVSVSKFVNWLLIWAINCLVIYIIIKYPLSVWRFTFSFDAGNEPKNLMK